jgi:glucose-6-phosphate 1-dehydrogenase
MSTFVFFGASGDLVAKKLLPAMNRLLKDGSLPSDTKIIGVSRKSWSDDDFREVVLRHAPDIVPASVSFVSGDVHDVVLPERLAKALSGQQSIFYLALSSTLYVGALSCIAETIKRGDMPDGSVRIAIEKPFGRNTDEAAELDDAIDRTVGEANVFRVDHYIQKESVQNILAYRFSNELFGGVWNERATARIEVFLHEAHTINGRGEFYDATGALNDVVQNHLLQMLAAATMDNPGQFSAARIHDARKDIFSRLRVAPHGLLRAQYEGYRETPGVAEGSETETFARIECFIDHPIWKDIPIILEAGKGLPERKSGVRMYLKQSGARICFDEQCDHEDVFEFLLAPEERTTLTVWGKKPGLVNALMPHSLTFSFSDVADAPYVDRSYDRVLYDLWRNDPSRFVSREESLAAWAFVDAARAALNATPLVMYEQSTLPHVIS